MSDAVNDKIAALEQQLAELKAAQTPAAPAMTAKELADAIASTQPPRKISIGEYMRNNTCKVKLKGRAYYENGRRIEEHLLSSHPDDTEFVELLNRVTRSGLYFDGTVQVDFVALAGGHNEVRIKWDCGVDRRRDIERSFGADGIKGAWRTIVAEQEALDREEADAKKETEARKRFFGQKTFGKQAESAHA